MTVPLERENRDQLLIKDAMIDRKNLKWKRKNLKAIYHNYCKTEYFWNYWEEFESVYNRHYSRLLDMNLNLLNFFFEKLGIKPDIRLTSILNISGEKEI